MTTSGEMMQITVNHSAPIQKGVQYLTHISTDPQFTAPIIVDHGSSPFSAAHHPAYQERGRGYARLLHPHRGTVPGSATPASGRITEGHLLSRSTWGA